jgi:hypothetical protein
MKEMSGVLSDQKHECMASNVAMWPYMACYVSACWKHYKKFN